MKLNVKDSFNIRIVTAAAQAVLASVSYHVLSHVDHFSGFLRHEHYSPRNDRVQLLALNHS